MKAVQQAISVSTRGAGLYDVTREVGLVVERAGIDVGLCTVFIKHTSASLVIQENADPAVLRDLQRWIEKLAPEDARIYEHDAEGLDDMPAHLRSSITRASEVIPIREGALGLGIWQAIYVWEHRRASFERELLITLIGS